MERLFEFATHHWPLVSIFSGLLAALILVESRRAGRTISSHQATHLINKESAVVLDLRDKTDYDQGHITGAINVPYGSFKTRLSEIESFKDKPVILVCKLGQHSGAIGKHLYKHGFKDVRRLAGGISTWLSDQLPLVKS